VDIVRPKQPKTKQYIAWGIGVIAVVAITIFLSKLKPAAPSVDGSTLWTDTVRRGDMVLDVRGPGNLVPEHVRQIVSVATGRIDKLLEQAGAHVQPNDVIIAMSNPDVEIQVLQSQQAWASARAALLQLEGQLQTQQLTQRSTIAQLKTALLQARNKARASDSMATRGLAVANEVDENRRIVEQDSSQLAFALQTLEISRQQADSQVAAQRDQVNGLWTVYQAQKHKQDGLTVRAGDSGVLQQDKVLELGQYITEGTVIGKVVQPDKLKATLRIPETQAKDVAVGQKAVIDTHNGLIPGHVARKDPSSQNGTVTVDVALDGPLPSGAVPDLSVDGTITIERLDNVLFTGRPGYGAGSGTVGLFKVVQGGDFAVRTSVELGRSSVNQVQILRGLAVGDTVILSDMSQWDAVDRVKCSPKCRVGQ
jgi:multidrug efflux pump subunit AcrA (membrane-fusion protein)